MLTFFKNLPARLARVTTGGKIIREIDGLRFLAIFPVVVQHLIERFERETPVEAGPYDAITQFIGHRGFLGVFVFFVISGFILGLPFAAHKLHGARKVKLGNYYWRRVTRLEPPYIIAMTVFAVAFVFMGLASFGEALPHYLASIVYLHNIVYSGWTSINPPVWTLEVEVQFYILAPFLALLFFNISNLFWRRVCMISFIAGILVVQFAFSIPHHQTLMLTLINHVHCFIVGFLLADIFLCEWSDGIRKHTAFNYLALASLVSMVLVWSWDHELGNRVGVTVCLFVLFYSVFRATWVNRFFTLPWITAIGGMCYSIYLIHLPFIELFIRLTKSFVFTGSFTINFLLQLLLITPFLLGTSIVFYLLVEKPCMYKDWPQRLRRYFARKSPAPVEQQLMTADKGNDE